jgi:hypothetical protein
MSKFEEMRGGKANTDQNSETRTGSADDGSECVVGHAARNRLGSAPRCWVAARATHVEFAGG